MALVSCPECKKEVSDSAITCPHCGYQLKQQQGQAIFKCADNGGWNTAWIKRTCDLIDESTGAIIKSFEMGGMTSIQINKPMRIKIHVHGYMGQPVVSLFPGKVVYVNITLKAGGALGGGFCNAEVVETASGIPTNSSSTGKASVSGGGCYIATCVYGSYDCSQVWRLRRYRDNYLDKSFLGRLFIKVYYSISPKLVKLFGNKEWFRKPIKRILDRKIKKLERKGYEDTPYNDKY